MARAPSVRAGLAFAGEARALPKAVCSARIKFAARVKAQQFNYGKTLVAHYLRVRMI
jgi:hypothetical protein